MDANYIKTCIDKIAKSALKSFEFKMEHEIDESKRVAVAKSCIQELCKFELEFKQAENLTQNFQSQSLETFDEDYKKAANQNIPLAQSNQRYENFIKEIEDIQFTMEQRTQVQVQDGFANVDGMEMQADEVTIDPLTKRQIINPVRNRICNHVYDKTILEVIQQNPKIRCPYVGCHNKNRLNEMDLIEDRDMKRRLQAKLQGESSLRVLE